MQHKAVGSGTATTGSGLPGRFRNSDSVTSSIFTPLPVGGEPKEGFPLSGRVSGELQSTIYDNVA